MLYDLELFKVSKETWFFAFAIVNADPVVPPIAGIAGLFFCACTAACVAVSVTAQFCNQAKIRLTSQLVGSKSWFSKAYLLMVKLFQNSYHLHY